MLNVKGSSTYLPLSTTIIIVSLYPIAEVFDQVPDRILKQLLNRFEEFYQPVWNPQQNEE